jgi:DNA-directed RNA polymerase subunit K
MIKLEENKDFTKYEIARILGARALQISMNAPVLTKISEEKLKEIKYDSLETAKIELQEGVLPISIKRPMPRRIEIKLELERKKIEKEQKIEEKVDVEKAAETAEEEIKEQSEIMELTKTEDDVESREESSSEEEGV